MRWAFFFALILPLLLVSCRDERAQAQRSLQEKGIPLRAEQVNAAVSRGDEKSLEQLLLCGVYAHQCDSAGITPLQLATNHSDVRLVRMLLKNGTGVTVNDASITRGGPLVTAALNGDIIIAKELLQHGANPNNRMEDGKPLLLWCIQHGRYIIADALLAHHADLHASDAAGNNALAYAFESKQRPLVEKLLAHGADPGRATQKDGAFTPPVIRCLEWGWHDILTTLVKRGADLHATDPHGKSALDYAIASGDESQWKMLLDLGLDGNATLADGQSLLIWSLAHQESISLKLLEKGADPNMQDAQQISILTKAIDQGKRQLTDALLARNANAKDPAPSTNATPLIMRTIEQGWIDLLEPLVKLGADVNAVNSQGQNAAVIALENGNENAFQKLIALQAKAPQDDWKHQLNAAAESGRTKQLQTLLRVGIRPQQESEILHLLDIAMKSNELATLEILLQHQIKHSSLYHRACETGSSALLQLLSKHDIKHDPALDAIYDHPIHAAIRSGNLEVLHYLLQHPHDIHVLGKENQTPLVCAIARHRLAMVRLLLQYKADPNRILQTKANAAFLSLFPGNGMRWYLTFDRNITPLMIAADSGKVELARTLIENGAKVGSYTAVNKTWPINFACRKADVPMMRLFLRKNPYIETQYLRVSIAQQQAELIDNCGHVIFSTKISTGKKGFATPTGTYVITNKHREWRSTIYHGASMPCFQRLSCGDFGFHQGIVPGYPASHGCLRVPYGNAQKLFELTQLGDRVVIE